MLLTLIFLLIHSNIFKVSLTHCCLLTVSVLLPNYSHKSRLFLGLNRSRGLGEILTCHPWFPSRNPSLPLFGDLRDLRVQLCDYVWIGGF